MSDTTPIPTEQAPLVLVGVDGSAASRRGLQFAARSATVGGGRLVIAHVIEWSRYRSTTLEDSEHRHVERLREVDAARAEVLDPARTEAERAGATVADAVVRHGHVAETLMALAREHGAEQLVVARTGDSRLRSIVFDSTPWHLVQVCTIPVTVVP